MVRAKPITRVTGPTIKAIPFKTRTMDSRHTVPTRKVRFVHSRNSSHRLPAAKLFCRALILQRTTRTVQRRLMTDMAPPRRASISKATIRTGNTLTCRLGSSNNPTMALTNNMERTRHKATAIQHMASLVPKVNVDLGLLLSEARAVHSQATSLVAEHLVP